MFYQRLDSYLHRRDCTTAVNDDIFFIRKFKYLLNHSAHLQKFIRLKYGDTTIQQ